MKELIQRTHRTLSVCFLAATLIAGAVSVHALTVNSKSAAVCGGGCTVVPRTNCGGGCFCDLTLGNGIDSGFCNRK